MAHEFPKVAEGRFKQQVKVIGHQDVAGKLDPVNFQGLGQDVDESFAVGIVFEDVFSFIAPARNVIYRAGVLDAQGSYHALL
jgi:hypothetical protein